MQDPTFCENSMKIFSLTTMMEGHPKVPHNRLTSHELSTISLASLCKDPTFLTTTMDNPKTQKLVKDKNNTVLSGVHTALLAGRLKPPKTGTGEKRRILKSSSSASFSSSETSQSRDVRCQTSEDLLVRLRGRQTAEKKNVDASSSLAARSSPASTSGSFRPARQPLTQYQGSRRSSFINGIAPSLTMEVDSQDLLPVRGPLHIVGSLEDLPPATHHSSARSFANPVTPRKAKLTLSAFRKPEETIRLTDCDPSRSLDNEYNLRAPGCSVIGHGAFSTVRLAFRRSDGAKVAIKSLSKYDALRARRIRRGGINKERDPKHLDEWEIMTLLQNNPHVLALLDVFETDEEIHLVTEYCEGGELFDAIKRKGAKRSSFRKGRYSEAQAARITWQILRALLDLHDHGIVHRDIKAENILLLNDDESDIQVKLADFGMARRHSAESSGTEGESSPSTPGLVYTTNAPPEVRGTGACGPAADVFSLGVTLYTLLCGFPPVFCDGLVEFPDAYWKDISDEAKSVVRAMVHSDPASRISVRSTLTHPWVRQQTTRVRRGSISANLELVRSRLYKTMGDAVSPSLKKRRRGSLTTLSPKKQRRLSNQLSISMTDLFAVSAKSDVRVYQNQVQPAPSSIHGQESEQ